MSTADPIVRPRSNSAIRLAGGQFLGNRAALVSFAFFLTITLACVFAPLIAPYDPVAISLSAKLKPPSFAHWLGTDYFGRDVLSRVLYGGQLSLTVALLVVVSSTLVGVPIGLLSGFAGGRIDNLLMRTMDAFLTFPPLLLAVAIVGVLGPSIENVMLALALVRVPVFARIVRSSTLSIREEVYIAAARVLGASWFRIVVFHVLRNAIAPIVVQITIVFAGAIVSEASISFLGLGAQPPTPSWGRDLNEARRYLEDAPWLLFGPAMAIMISVLSVNFIGDGLRDALDPRAWRTLRRANAPAVDPATLPTK
ncbi:MAG: ABC transporter permease [Rhodobiaceae bacterium]|nr:ABC transporter permease [Rhodobiaceae bacterium]